MATQNGKTLQVLDFCDCEGLDFESIQHIIDYCIELKEVCFANWDEHYTEDCIDYLANNLTTKVHITLCLLTLLNLTLFFTLIPPPPPPPLVKSLFSIEKQVFSSRGKILL